MNGIAALISGNVRITARRCKPGSGPSPDPELAHTSIFYFLTSRPVRNKHCCLSTHFTVFPGASQVALVFKNPPTNAGEVRDASLIPGLGRSLGGGHSNPLQCSCLENPMDRGAWWATVHRVSQSRTRQKQLSTSHTHLLIPGVHQTPSLFQALR